MIDLLRQVPLFRNLSMQHLESISQISTTKTFNAGQILFREKETGTVFFILGSGSVKIYTAGSNGEEKILSTFKTGESFGELALIDGKPRSATAQTMEYSTLYLIDGKDFIEVMKTHFDIAICIMQELSQRLRDTNAHVHDLTFLDARTRVIKNLVMLANKNGTRTGNQIHMKVMLNYDELSHMAGVQKGTLMEVIREFQTRGLLTLGSDSFSLDLSKLRG